MWEDCRNEPASIFIQGKWNMLMCFVGLQAALAHLESLAIDVEQAQPPATEQIIDCLPQITIHADNTGTNSML